MTNEPSIELSNPRLQGALERVLDQARTRPLTTLGVAAGVGLVLGGGMPRVGVLMGLAVAGGVVGFGVPRLLRMRMQDDGADASSDDASTEDEASEDVSTMNDAGMDDAGIDDASGEEPPASRHHRNRSKKRTPPRMPQV